MRFSRHFYSWTAVLAALVLFSPSSVRAAEAATNKWEKEIQAYVTSDQTNPPPKNAILFIGSSSTRLWKTLQKDFPDHKVINRGFGGSQIADSTYFAPRVIFPYKPRQIVLQAGGNDINAKKSPEQVFEDFKQFVKVVRAELPDVKISFTAINPSPARADQVDKQKKLNDMVKAYVAQEKNMDFIDLFDAYMGTDGQPRADLYGTDRLHNNPAGYKVRADIVRPHLLPAP